jgi:hypothetical protein
LLVAFFLASSSPPSSQPDYFSIIVTSIIVLIAAILGALVTYFLSQRQVRKGLFYRIVSNTPILGAQKEIEGRVKILFDKNVHRKPPEGIPQKPPLKGPFQNMSRVFNTHSNLREVKDLRLAVIEVQNAGRTAILQGEFNEPITFTFTGQSEILDTDIVEVKPNDLKPVLKSAAKSVKIMPLLLNRNDRVRLKILVAGSDGEIEVTARIAGIEKIVDYKEVEKSRQKRYRLIGIIFSLIGLPLFAVAIIISFSLPRPAQPPIPTYLWVMLAVGMIFFFLGTLFILTASSSSSNISDTL